MSKLIGLITAWGAEPFIEPAIKQAIEFCDDVIVSVSANHPSYHEFEDNTLKICVKYADKISLVSGVVKNSHPDSKGDTMKRMLDSTGNNKKDNWIWILDADEFYFDDDVVKIRELLDTDYTEIETPEKFFLVNMKYYIKTVRTRIKKLTKDNVSFHTNLIKNGGEQKRYKLDTNLGMHHYSFLLNPHFKRMFWKHHYNGKNPTTDSYIEWLDKVYLNLDVNNQEKYIDICKNLFNKDHILGPLFEKNTTNNGYLFEYFGDYPKYIKESKLNEIENFRTIYGKKKI